MGYTRDSIIAGCQEALQTADTFYQAPFVNYRGTTTDTKEYYTEVVAEFLCNHINAYKSGIQRISRESYKIKSHEKVVLSETNREEENIAKKIFMQSRDLGPLDYIGCIEDYQTPLNAKKGDGAGKIDLLSFDGKTMRILELKKPESKESMLRCVLEGFTYLQIVDPKALAKSFDHDPKTVIVKASPLVFLGSEQHREMLQKRPFLRKLMTLLDSEPYYLVEEEKERYAVVKHPSAFAQEAAAMRHEMSVKARLMRSVPAELLGGTFQGRTYSHICKHLKDNFIDKQYPTKKSIKGTLTDADIKYHYAEHLNSSQAMCIGYFKKFFETGKGYEPVLGEILKKQGIDLEGCSEFSDAVFEHIPDPKEGTNFDFYLKTANGRQITWEIKFTERDFGGTTKKEGAEDRYIEKYEEIYIPMMRECAYYRFPDVLCDDYRCLETGALTDDCDVTGECSIHEFYKHYQIRRNILYAKNPGDYVLFLTPRENRALDEGRAYIEDYASKWDQSHIKNIYWEDLLDTTLQVVAEEPELCDYYTKFKEKYFG